MKTQLKITFALMVAFTISAGIIGCGGASTPPKGPDTPTEHGDEDPETGKKIGS